MFKEISPENLVKIYEALNRKATGKVAVKLSTGEPGGHNFLQPALIKDLVQKVNGTIVECNTAYGGGRADTESHLKAAADHGFTAIAPVDIMDSEGETALLVHGGKHLKENYVGAHYPNYDFTIILSHFKGHAMGGFGGAIKNMSIGIASSTGKAWIHSAGKTKGNPWENLPAQDDFLESMAEAAKSVAEHCGEKIIYISVANNLSVDCDCDASPEDPKMGDIGILASRPGRSRQGLYRFGESIGRPRKNPPHRTYRFPSRYAYVGIRGTNRFGLSKIRTGKTGLITINNKRLCKRPRQNSIP